MRNIRINQKLGLLFLFVLAFAGISVGCYQLGDVVNDAVEEMKSPKPMVQATQQIMVSADIKMLKDYHWVLVSASRQGADILHFSQAIKQKRINLKFGDTLAFYSVGCNQISAEYQLRDDILHLHKSLSTLKACGSLDVLERRLNDQMSDESQIKISVDKHTGLATLIQTKGADVLTWQGTKTYQAQFGEPIRLFWEIDNQTVRCVDEQNNPSQCLRIRSINYDQQGIKIGSGAWRTFYGEIKGYKHDKNLRKTIRLNAYSNPKDKQNPIYVYDGSVETHWIKP